MSGANYKIGERVRLLSIPLGSRGLRVGDIGVIVIVMPWGAGVNWERTGAYYGVGWVRLEIAPGVKPTKPRPAPKPKKWEPVDLREELPRLLTIAILHDKLDEASATINTMGRKLTALENKAKEKKA